MFLAAATADIDKHSPPITRSATSAEILAAPSIFDWCATPMPKNVSCYQRNRNSMFSPRRSAIRKIPPPAPSAFATQVAATRINWVHHNDFPRELRDKIYSYALPSNILCPGAQVPRDLLPLLLIDQRSSRECMEVMKGSHHCTLEFTSNAAMVAALDAAPASSLAAYKKLTIKVSGAYNLHSNICGNNNGCHRTNISPTLHRDGNDVWFPIGLPCLDCIYEPFIQRELAYACATLTGKFERLTGLQLPRRVHIHTFVFKDDPAVPHVRAYRLEEIWQPWKRVRPENVDDDFDADNLSLVYEHDDLEGYYYAGFKPPRGLGAQVAEKAGYLIL